jgi:tRNA uridine 5-carboxymethylaminomethyl modification enzyme
MDAANSFLVSNNSAALVEKTKALKLLLRPGIGLKDMMSAIPALAEAINEQDPLILEQVEIQAKYEVYIEKEQELVSKMANLENLLIPDSFDYEKLSSISSEARQKLQKIKPATLGQASRISGVNPSDVQILMVYMGR